MPSKSWKQHKLMEKAAHDPEFAKEKGIDQEVAKEWIEADKKAGLTTEEAFKKLHEAEEKEKKKHEHKRPIYSKWK